MRNLIASHASPCKDSNEKRNFFVVVLRIKSPTRNPVHFCTRPYREFALINRKRKRKYSNWAFSDINQHPSHQRMCEMDMPRNKQINQFFFRKKRT